MSYNIKKLAEEAYMAGKRFYHTEHHKWKIGTRPYGIDGWEVRSRDTPNGREVFLWHYAPATRGVPTGNRRFLVAHRVVGWPDGLGEFFSRTDPV